VGEWMLRVLWLLGSSLCIAAPAVAQPTSVPPTINERPSSPATAAEPRAGCPRERPIFKITNEETEEPTQKEKLKTAVATPGAIVLLRPDVDLHLSQMPSQFFP